MRMMKAPHSEAQPVWTRKRLLRTVTLSPSIVSPPGTSRFSTTTLSVSTRSVSAGASQLTPDGSAAPGTVLSAPVVPVFSTSG